MRQEFAPLTWDALAAVPVAAWGEVQAYARATGLSWADAAATDGWRRRRDLLYSAWEQEGRALSTPT